MVDGFNSPRKDAELRYRFRQRFGTETSGVFERVYIGKERKVTTKSNLTPPHLYSVLVLGWARSVHSLGFPLLIFVSPRDG